MHHLARRFSFSPSSSSTRETSKLERGSNYIWSLRNSAGASSSAAAAAASDDIPKTVKKKISKQDRISMVASFVNNYRAKNGGKFPTANEAMKEVGGGFYFVWKIVQEMQYESQMGQSLKTQVTENKEEPFNHASRSYMEVKTQKDYEFQNAKEPEPEVPSEGPKMSAAEMPVNDGASETADNFEEIILTSEGKLKENLINKDDQQLESPETEKPTRDISKEQNDDAESPKKSAWTHLKSLADGIVNWRKIWMTK